MRDNPNFLRGLDERQVPYACAVQNTFGCRLPDEVQAIAAQTPVYGGRGQPRKPRPAPLHTVKEVIEAQPASAWQTVAWREGTKGMMQIQAVAIRVHWVTGSTLHSTSHSRVHTGPEGWLLAERPLSQAVADDPQPTPAEPQEKGEEKIKYWFSMLPTDTSLQRLVLLAHARWVIEQFYEDAKQECGFDHYQGRSWDGLHRHLALVMLAYSFLMLYRLTLPLPPAPPPSREVRCLACIGRCCSGCSRISSFGFCTPSKPSPSVPEETNRVVLGDQRAFGCLAGAQRGRKLLWSLLRNPGFITSHS